MEKPSEMLKHSKCNMGTAAHRADLEAERAYRLVTLVALVHRSVRSEARERTAAHPSLPPRPKSLLCVPLYVFTVTVMQLVCCPDQRPNNDT
jgi:hypothetical protein